MLRRLNGWDYTGRAIYQITVVLKDRARAPLGRLEVRRGASAETARAQDEPQAPTVWLTAAEARRLKLAPNMLEARVVPSAWGLAALEALDEMPRHCPAVEILARQLMPDHLHFVAFVKAPIDQPFGALVRGFKAGATKRWLALGGGDRSVALPLAWPPRRALGYFAALGNADLLARPLVQVQVSRRDFGYRRIPKPGGGHKIARDANGEPIVEFTTPAFDEKRDALLAVARHGAVLVSPCISDGERQIARVAFAARLPLVAMRNAGFTSRAKPVGRAFDACADGRLLLLAPAGWGAPRPKTAGRGTRPRPGNSARREMTRLDAVAMNRLCQGLVGEGAAEINYHGMKPADIDALAREAALLEEQT